MSAADKLARWNYEQEWGGDWDECSENAKYAWIKAAQETLEFLATTGFGLVQEAQAVALEETADALMDGAPDDPANKAAARWLRARAATLRGGE